ncbi:MAG TPA: hypothetical protein VGC44_05455 [Longimicrobiales bacterium]
MINQTCVSALALAAGLLLSACRDGASPFLLEQTPFDTAGGGQLTFSIGNDRAPVWNRAGDSIYYVAESFPPFRDTPGLLLAAPARGGVVSPLLEVRQLRSTRRLWLTGATVSPDGNSAAFVDLIDVASGTGCFFSCSTTGDTTLSEPRLTMGVLRVSRLDPNSVSDVDTMRIPFQGRELLAAPNPFGLPGIWEMRAYPFQRRFLRHGSHIFRPSWSPDGARLVYSDGLQLLIYNTQTRQTIPIANTRDAIYPAWSPQGDWIAFSQLERRDSTTFDCLCIERRLNIVLEAHERTVYRHTELGDARLKVIRPNGSEQRDLGFGETPAWTPDGQSLVFRRANELWRSALDGTGAARILNTDFGEEPSVSPDGQRVAFARLNELHYDIWVVPLRTQ